MLKGFTVHVLYLKQEQTFKSNHINSCRFQQPGDFLKRKTTTDDKGVVEKDNHDIGQLKNLTWKIESMNIR